jgi:hypothetical protein
MGRQSNKVIKRKRRQSYIKRKKTAIKAKKASKTKTAKAAA